LSAGHLGPRAAIEIHSENISRHKLGTVNDILRKKVLLWRNSVCLGIAHSEGRKGPKFREEMFLKVMEVFTFSINGSERNSV
jgi:hypothetical protein